MAEGSANIWGLQLTGQDDDRSPWVYTSSSRGGTGARPAQDGLSATAFPSGVLGTPVEVVESLAPLLIERKALRDGSGGDGRYRGGLGQVIAFRVRSDEPATCSVLCDRTRIPALGFFGAFPALPAQAPTNVRP